MAQVNEAENQVVYPRSGWTLVHVKDTAANDSDKTITVPDGKIWEFLTIHVTYACTATAGNRVLQAVWRDEDATALHTTQAVNNIIANATETLQIDSHIQAPNETVATYHYFPMAFDVMPAGWSIRIWDSAAVDAAADDMTIHALVKEYTPV